MSSHKTDSATTLQLRKQSGKNLQSSTIQHYISKYNTTVHSIYQLIF